MNYEPFSASALHDIGGIISDHRSQIKIKAMPYEPTERSLGCQIVTVLKHPVNAETRDLINLRPRMALSKYVNSILPPPQLS